MVKNVGDLKSKFYTDHRHSPARVCCVVMGYIISLVGALSIFRIGMLQCMLILVAGMVVVALASRNIYPSPKITWRIQLVWIAGVLVIIGCLSYIGDDRIRKWTPHPASYQLVWSICIVAYQHMRAIIQRDSVPKT